MHNSALADFNAALELVPDHAGIYHERGVVYIQKGNLDHAIADFGEALKLDPKLDNAYTSRGVAYYEKGEYALALADYNNALKLNSGHPKNHGGRGRTHLAMEKFDRAIADLTKAIKSQPNREDFYHYRADAYREKGDFANALADYDEVLRLDPQSAIAYQNRGATHQLSGQFKLAFADYDAALKLYKKEKKKQAENISGILCNKGAAYISLENFKEAFKSFRGAVVHSPNMAHTDPSCHISFNLKTDDAFEALLRIASSVHAIQKQLLIGPSKRKQRASHYTELNALQQLVGGGKFRLYNADYMNDSQEGKTLWEIINKMAGHDCYEAIHSDESEESLSPVYIGSFTRENPSAQQDGELFLWRTYGKDAGVEAAGACLYFDIRKFSDTPNFNFGRMRHPNQESRSAADALQADCIYEVRYANRYGLIGNKQLQGYLKDLAENLSLISKTSWKPRDKKTVYRMTRELLDQIRFLFKSHHYQNEQEWRILRSRYAADPALPGKDETRQPPRLYLEAKNLDLRAVTLGPMTQDVLVWIHWLKSETSVIKIHHSKIPYGKKTR